MTMYETKSMREDEMRTGRYVCVIHPEAGCLYSPHITIHSGGMWVKGEESWSSGHSSCITAKEREEMSVAEIGSDGMCGLILVFPAHETDPTTAITQMSNGNQQITMTKRQKLALVRRLLDEPDTKPLTVPDRGFGGQDMTYEDENIPACLSRHDWMVVTEILNDVSNYTHVREILSEIDAQVDKNHLIPTNWTRGPEPAGDH